MPDQIHIELLDQSFRAASTAVKYNSTSVQNVAKSPQRVTCGRRAGIGIDLHRDRLVCMPQDSHDHARMNIEVDEQRGTCMPGVVNSEPTYSRDVAGRRELPVESPGINWRAITTGEDQRRHVVRLLPDLAGSLPLSVLLDAPDLQCRGHDVGHGEQGVGCLGFRLPIEERSPDSLELMVGHQCALPEIDGLPSQAENLTLAKTED
jgi:hypothetical protein